MASGILYTYPENFRAYKILIAAKYSGAHVKVAPDFVFGETNKTKNFLKKFPLGKVPAFESDDKKLFLSESNAIAFYVANKQLRGSSPLDEALILQWLSFADSEILPASCAWVFPVLGIIPINKKATERAKKDIETALNALNIHLLHKTYLVGERITLADICVACTLLHLYQNVLDPNFRKPFENVNRWFMTIINQPQVKSVIGNIKLCEQPTEANPRKYVELQNNLKEKESGKQKEKEQVSKIEAKKCETEEPEPGAEAKSNDQCGPPDETFDMESFKRFYSNEEVEKSIPYFWQKFDPENYSIWYSEYKYPEELQKVFMSCNLITGMFQRLDKMRKNAFASVCLFGKDNDSTISGIWVWKGHGLVFELSQDWQVDYESYDWVKLDPKDPKTKELVGKYLSWEVTDKSGRQFNQGKIFK